MTRWRRPGAQRVFATAIALMLATVLACTSSNTPGGTGTSAPSGPGTLAAAASQIGTGDGWVPEADWRARQDDYLRFATSKPMSPGSVGSVLAYAERARREPGFTFDAAAVTPAAYAESFEFVRQLKDTSDFRVNDWLFLVYGYRDVLPKDTVAAFEQAFLGAKYWWTEPTPPGVIDSQYYWTENHQIIFLANEYAAGQMFPDKQFAINGVTPTMTGRAHMTHAKTYIERWIDLRARFGWSEWLSNVYYMEDVKGLLLLAEWADDTALATKAASALDLLLFEMAAHTQAGTFGATHGRSYSKDKMTGFTEDTFSSAKLLFDDTAYAYPNIDNASLFATARRYRPAEVTRKVARDDVVSVDRMRAGLPLDPSAPITANPQAPYGLSYEDPENLMVWWGMAAWLSWPVVPLSADTMKKYDLWKSSNFAVGKDLEPIVATSSTAQLQQLALTLAPQMNAGLLSQVDTYTWRSPEVMLSSAQDWRPGMRSEQNHAWQATLDAQALVFTTHPSKPPTDSTKWSDNDFFSGNGSTPRVGQFENVAVSIYNPAYAPGGPGPLKAFSYEPYTHAFFPQEHFDEVVQRGDWIVGRKGDGYVALWSWRPVRWQDRDPASLPGGFTKPFQLIADGGADNVWVTEVSRAADWSGKGGFTGFVDALVKAAPLVDSANKYATTYSSPSKGNVTFGWGDRPLQVAGKDVDLHGYGRYDNPWAKAPFDTKQFTITAGGYRLVVDFDKGTRTASRA